jgi:hypothetical protein
MQRLLTFDFIKQRDNIKPFLSSSEKEVNAEIRSLKSTFD